MKKSFWFLIGLLTFLIGCSAGETAVSPTAAPSPTPAIQATAVPTSLPPTTEPTQTPAPTETAVPQENFFTTTIPAPSLAENMLGEPAEREIAVYLPPSYYESTTRYPVIYYLAGFEEGLSDSYTLRSLMDTMVADGTVQEMIIVEASGYNLLGGSFYVNSPVTGNWEDFVIHDLVQYTDSNFRTIPAVESRGIAGFSMGGFGALNLAMRHPEIFGAVYALSPGLFAPDGLASSQMFAAPYVAESFLALEDELASLSPEEAQAQFLHWTGSSHGDLGFTVAYGAAFAPDPDKNAPYIDFPYTAADGPVDEATWQRWESGFGGVTDEVAAYKDNFLQLKGIVIDYGTRDPYRWIPAGCDFLSAELTAAGIPHELQTFAGGHGNLVGRAKDVMLPFFSNTLLPDITA
ncbi:MAG: alpha/beta hydrolase [Ardenticatenaceae bacterium]|nr:alpha/beta hydrolase [Ardenticatenaceae bacterium]MCB8987129.1 alpha/beta hydrolase [Ardenticatenaceae bacterium]